jgi:hypothetical protein
MHSLDGICLWWILDRQAERAASRSRLPKEYLRRSRLVIARMRPISAAGKASGSRSWRNAMYCAVHSLTPRIDRSRRTASSSPLVGSKRCVSARVTAPTAESAATRLRGMPRDASDLALELGDCNRGRFMLVLKVVPSFPLHFLTRCRRRPGHGRSVVCRRGSK